MAMGIIAATSHVRAFQVLCTFKPISLCLSLLPPALKATKSILDRVSIYFTLLPNIVLTTL